MSGAVAGPCDAGVAAAVLPCSNQHPRATLAATILGLSVAFIDGSVVNVALPALARDLGAGPAELSWTINAYLLPLGALILLGGGAGDHFGRRRLFLLGLAIFTLASLLCAAARAARGPVGRCCPLSFSRRLRLPARTLPGGAAGGHGVCRVDRDRRRRHRSDGGAPVRGESGTFPRGGVALVVAGIVALKLA